jgi:hypothetical protein
MGIDTHADWITGSYATDVQYLLEVAENNPLRSNPTLANLGPKLDSVQSVFIGYGYDLLQNAADAAGDLQDAGATIADPDGLKSLLEGLQAPLTPADVSDIASYISVANTPAAIAQFANSLLNSEIAIVEDQLSTFIQEKLGIAGDILPSNERVALMDLYYNDPGGEGKRGFFLNANGTLTHLSQALQAGNRAEVGLKYGTALLLVASRAWGWFPVATSMRSSLVCTLIRAFRPRRSRFRRTRC